jgi:c-di-GMP-binding flagellar brake protein YcgR
MPETGTETLAHRLELDEADTYSQYFLHSPTEIVFVLRAAMQKGAMMTVFFDMGKSFFLSSILSVAPEGIVLDCGSHEETNLRALKATRLACTLNVDRVKVQFALETLSPQEFDGHPAFFSILPERILRLQRREYFRISTPMLRPPKCVIDFPGPAEDDNGDAANATTATDGTAEARHVEFSLVDISAGGLSLRVPPAHSAFFRRGILLENCVLSLPESGAIRVKLSVRMILEVTLQSGQRFFRAGCEFVDPPRSLPTTVQRYIITLERERKARLNGME